MADNEQVRKAITWTVTPGGLKLNSMSSMLALQVALIGTLTLTASIYFFMKAGGEAQIGKAAVCGAVYFATLAVVYTGWMSLMKSPPPVTDQEAPGTSAQKPETKN